MARGQAKLAIAEGVSVWVMEAPDGFGEPDFHSHHALQISLALAGTLTLATHDRVHHGPALAVASDAPHRLGGHGLIVLVFVEPESPIGRALSLSFASEPIVALDAERLEPAMAPLRATFDEKLDRAALLAAGHAALQALAPPPAAAPIDPRVRRIIDHAIANLERPLTLVDGAHGVHLSPGRLRHLFVEQTGLAFKTYLLWLRLMKAIERYSEGRSLTEAAHDAGFADSAHFSRTFRRTFGVPATTLTRI